jgi:high-affinity nickel-transport protein
MSATGLLLVGFLLGMRHAIDPDHVVAVTTIVTREGTLRRAQWIGALWGIGHSATVFLVGGAIALFKLVVPPNLVLGLEFCVALMLIGLGVANLRSAPARVAGGVTRPLAVGFVHGLAGSAFIAMLISTGIPSPMLAGWYLLLFGVGTVAGMMLLTSAIAMPSIYFAGRYDDARRHLRLASGVASIAFGLFLAHQVGVSEGLFGAVTGWVPR